MTADKPDPRIPPIGVYDYEEPVPNERRSIALGLPPQRLSWLDEATNVAAAMQSAGYLKPPTRWQRFKAWVSRLFGRGS